MPQVELCFPSCYSPEQEGRTPALVAAAHGHAAAVQVLHAGLHGEAMPWQIVASVALVLVTALLGILARWQNLEQHECLTRACLEQTVLQSTGSWPALHEARPKDPKSLPSWRASLLLRQAYITEYTGSVGVPHCRQENAKIRPGQQAPGECCHAKVYKAVQVRKYPCLPRLFATGCLDDLLAAAESATPQSCPVLVWI